MSVKIFLPKELFSKKEDCDIYGEVQINENNAVSYFVIEGVSAETDVRSQQFRSLQKLRHLGYIESAARTAKRRDDVSLIFNYSIETANVYLRHLSIKPSQADSNIFLYEPNRLSQLHEEYVSGKSSKEDDVDDLEMLCKLLRSQYSSQKQSKAIFLKRLGGICNLPLHIMTLIFMILMEWKPLKIALKKTTFFEHYEEWKKLKATGRRNSNLIMDRILGMCVMLILLLYISQPENYLLKSSHFVIGKLRQLLNALKGSPIGLKLNVQLNNFLLDSFKYHVDLWSVFLESIKPLIQILFVPIALLGSMGLSYQLALLADLISVIGLHAHCFYIYSALLYKVEIKGIRVLYKVMLGKRYNVLKKRVESHNYMNRQLYLATIFFTTLLFLFPTILVYYTVFTTLRLCVYLVSLVLECIRRRILAFPLYLLCKWLCRRFYQKESIQVQHRAHSPLPLLQSHEAAQLHMSFFDINVQTSSLSRVFSCESAFLQEWMVADERTSIKGILNRILEGEF